MKKIMILVATVLAILVLSVFTMAVAFGEEVAVPASDAAGKFTVTSPMETAAVGFWLPATGTFAMGLAHTVVRVTHSDIPKFRLDLDGTIAQEVSGGSGVNDEKVTLGGIGLKLGYNISKTDKTGFVFEPSLGGTYLNDFKKFRTATDIIGNKKFAIYGTALLYKW